MTGFRTSSVDLIYSETGDGKTATLGDAAEFYYQRTGLPSLLISSDPGGWDTIKAHCDAGVVLPFKLIRERPNPMWDMELLVRGHRPKDLTDPFSPLSAEPQLDDISAIFFDGITSMCEILFEWHLHSITVSGNIVTPGDVKIGGLAKENFIFAGPEHSRRISSQTDYGEIQKTARGLLNAAARTRIPIIFTALPCKGEDDNSRPINGPQFTGKALTGSCGNLFGNMLHLFPIYDKEGNRTVKMFLKNHVDPRDPLKVVYPAKVRAPKILKDKVPLYMDPDIGQLYTALESMQAEAARLIRARVAANANVSGAVEATPQATIAS